MDEATSRAFQERARLSRATVGVNTHALRPESATLHVDIAVPGFVGSDYSAGGLCILSVNPAGGKGDYQTTSGDRLIYDAAAALAAADAEGASDELTRLGEAFVLSMPSWGSQWRHVNAILEASRIPLNAIAYVYLLPFRTKDDAGSKLPLRVLQSAVQFGFFDLLDSLRAGRIIAMDRSSEAAARNWQATRASASEVLYYTRKRDDHAGRAAFLKQLGDTALQSK